MRYNPALDGIRGYALRALIAVLWLSFIGAAGLAIYKSLHSPTVVVYGDSIAVGKGARFGWPSAVGAKSDAKSGRALADDPGAAQRITAQKANVVWIAIGTNDYGKSKWTHKEFQRAYGKLLDDLHAGLPQAKVYAQTPLLRKDEGPNSIGSTMYDYRVAIMTECGKRAWVRCIDGTSILHLNRMPDGLHPDDYGQQDYAEFAGPIIRGAVPGRG